MKKLYSVLALLIIAAMFSPMLSCTEAPQDPVVDAPAAMSEDTPAADVPTEVPEESPSPSPSEEATTYEYTNDQIGFTVDLPLAWQDTCEIVERDDSVTFYSTASGSSLDEDGNEVWNAALFTIMLVSIEDKDEDGSYMFPSYYVAGSTGDHDIVVLYPTDVQYTADGEAEYVAMSDQIADIVGSITFG